MAEKDTGEDKQRKQDGAGKAPAKAKAKAKPRAKAKPKDKETSVAESKPAARTAKKDADTSEKKTAPKRTPKAPSKSTNKEAAPAAPSARKRSGAGASGSKAAKPPARRRAAAEPSAERSGPALQRPVVRARAKYIRSSARKARLVMDHVRGKSVGDARAVLRHSPRGVARDVERLLESAIANAENNHDLVGDELYVKEIYADEGPTLKRYQARAQGRVYRIRKRTSHLTVTLTPKE